MMTYIKFAYVLEDDYPKDRIMAIPVDPVDFIKWYNIKDNPEYYL